MAVITLLWFIMFLIGIVYIITTRAKLSHPTDASFDLFIYQLLTSIMAFGVFSSAVLTVTLHLNEKPERGIPEKLALIIAVPNSILHYVYAYLLLFRSTDRLQYIIGTYLFTSVLCLILLICMIIKRVMIRKTK